MIRITQPVSVLLSLYNQEEGLIGAYGAGRSSSEVFLDVVQPQFVVISAGDDNRYDHPHEEVLERAADVGAVVLRTDEQGTIKATSDGQRLWWETSP